MAGGTDQSLALSWLLENGSHSLIALRADQSTETLGNEGYIKTNESSSIEQSCSTLNCSSYSLLLQGGHIQHLTFLILCPNVSMYAQKSTAGKPLKHTL